MGQRLQRFDTAAGADRAFGVNYLIVTAPLNPGEREIHNVLPGRLPFLVPERCFQAYFREHRPPVSIKE